MGLPMVDLMWSDLTFCQFFLRSETRKLMPANNVSIATTQEGGTREETD